MKITLGELRELIEDAEAGPAARKHEMARTGKLLLARVREAVAGIAEEGESSESLAHADEGLAAIDTLFDSVLSRG